MGYKNHIANQLSCGIKKSQVQSSNIIAPIFSLIQCIHAAEMKCNSFPLILFDLREIILLSPITNMKKREITY